MQRKGKYGFGFIEPSAKLIFSGKIIKRNENQTKLVAIRTKE
jgi:hypothetical protein